MPASPIENLVGYVVLAVLATTALCYLLECIHQARLTVPRVRAVVQKGLRMCAGHVNRLLGRRGDAPCQNHAHLTGSTPKRRSKGKKRARVKRR
mmetsp:Transcript_31628/g.97753  ORF Transcript_31628/g.97753 Transcript_31628/m.97753 type:complete len:94 (+) Transcript_31628:50-331(+)